MVVAKCPVILVPAEIPTDSQEDSSKPVICCRTSQPNNSDKFVRQQLEQLSNAIEERKGLNAREIGFYTKLTKLAGSKSEENPLLLSDVAGLYAKQAQVCGERARIANLELKNAEANPNATPENVQYIEREKEFWRNQSLKANKLATIITAKSVKYDEKFTKQMIENSREFCKQQESNQ